MTDNHLATDRLRRLKWLIIILTVLTITAGEIFRIFTQNTSFSHIIIWFISLVVAIVLIQVAFHKLGEIQAQLESVSSQNQIRERQQSSLLRLSEKLASITDIKDICQIILQELQDTLGGDCCVACQVNAADGQKQVFTQPESLTSDGKEPGAAKPRIIPEDTRRDTKPNSLQPVETRRIEIPMQVGQIAVGELVVETSANMPLSEDTYSILRGVANQAAMAIENARLGEQRKTYQLDAERREAELRVREHYLSLLNEITRASMKSQDFQDTLHQLVDYIGKLLEADSVLILLWDPIRKQMTPASAYGPLRQIYRSLRLEPSDLPLVASVMNSARTLEIKNTTNSPYISSRLSAQLQIRALLALPLIADEQKLGVALLTYKNEHSFQPREISLAEQTTNQLALTIAKYHALDELHHRTQELAALQKATTALLTTLDLEVLLGQILDAAISAIPSAEKGTLHLVARDTGQLQLRAVQGYTDPRIRTFNPTDSASYTAIAVRERKSLLISDAHAEPGGSYGEDIPEIRAISSMIIAPLILGGKTLGAISLDSYRRYAFTESDLQLLVSFAATATTAINNAQLYTEVQKQAITDPLTGLYNRRGFFELGRREVERAHRFNRPLTAMMIDIDLFKQVNDTKGHLVGDQVLASVATQIERQLRQVDLPGRYGGDEFIALLPETDLFNAYQAAERLRRSIAKVIYPTENETMRISVSIGIAALKQTGETLETLIERADQALYTAKQSGRNRTVQATAQLESKPEEKQNPTG